MWFCKNSVQQSIKSSYLHIRVLNCLQLSIVDINWMAGSVFGGISYNVSTIFAKSREKSHRLWTKNLSLVRGLLALQIKIPLGIHFLGPWEGGKRFYFFFLSLWLHPLATLGASGPVYTRLTLLHPRDQFRGKEAQPTTSPLCHKGHGVRRAICHFRGPADTC